MPDLFSPAHQAEIAAALDTLTARLNGAQVPEAGGGTIPPASGIVNDSQVTGSSVAAALNALATAIGNIPPPANQFATPQDYGAIGDGTTDDTAAFQAALTAESVLFVPPGTYLCDRLFGKASQKVYGAGRSSIIKMKPQSFNPWPTAGQDFGGVLNYWGTSYASPLENVTLRDLTFDGNFSAHTPAGYSHNVDAMNFQRVRGFHIENSLAINGVADGFDFDASRDGAVINCHSKGNGKWGYHTTRDFEDNRSQNIRYLGCLSEMNGTRSVESNGTPSNGGGFDANRADFITFMGCIARNNVGNVKTRGFYVKASTEILFQGLNISGTAAGNQSADLIEA